MHALVRWCAGLLICDLLFFSEKRRNVEIKVSFQCGIQLTSYQCWREDKPPGFYDESDISICHPCCQGGTQAAAVANDPASQNSLLPFLFGFFLVSNRTISFKEHDELVLKDASFEPRDAEHRDIFEAPEVTRCRR